MAASRSANVQYESVDVDDANAHALRNGFGRSRLPDFAVRGHLPAAVREKDRRHLITVGLVDWSLDRKGLTSGFVPEKVVADLDFVSVHLYPESGKLAEAVQTLQGFSVGKPVVVEEVFPLSASPIRNIPHFQFISKTFANGKLLKTCYF